MAWPVSMAIYSPSVFPAFSAAFFSVRSSRIVSAPPCIRCFAASMMFALSVSPAARKPSLASPKACLILPVNAVPAAFAAPAYLFSSSGMSTIDLIVSMPSFFRIVLVDAMKPLRKTSIARLTLFTALMVRSPKTLGRFLNTSTMPRKPPTKAA